MSTYDGYHLTLGIPTALVGILVNNSRLSDLRSHVDERFSTLEKFLDARFEAPYQELLRVEGVLDARLSHLKRMSNRNSAEAKGPME